MRVGLVGKDLSYPRTLLRRFGLNEEKNPEVVISWGGDGTLLEAERRLPGVPKLPIRDPAKYKKCVRHRVEKILKEFRSGNLPQSTFTKLELVVQKRKNFVTSEVSLSSKSPTQAIRFKVWVNGQSLSQEPLIGDGLLIATPFGATGYFNSLTRTVFTQGVGVAFKNVVNPPRFLGFLATTLVLETATRLAIEVVRGPALLVWDNNPELFELEKDAMFEVQTSLQKTTILALDQFRCRECQRDSARGN